MPNPSKKPIIVPPTDKMSNPQLEDIRLMLADTIPTDYAVVSGDYFFSDKELMDAMRRAVEFYNSQPPQTIKLTLFNVLHSNAYMFKVGACWQACLSKLEYYKRKSITYNSGGVQSNIYLNTIQGLEASKNEFKQEFIGLVRQDKLNKNVYKGFGQVG